MLEALHYHRGDTLPTKTAFLCPLDKCVHRIGLNFFKGGWHPFVETLREYEKNNNLKYENSSLKKYYDSWQPENAAQAYIGFSQAPEIFNTLPPHLMFLTPWSSNSIEQMDRKFKQWQMKDDAEHSESQLNLRKDGYRDFGPVSEIKGNLEFNRLLKVYDSISDSGYDRNYGDIGVLVLKRESEYRFLLTGGGYHRAAAMVALGYEMAPAYFFRPWFISLNEIDYWSQIQKKIWTHDSGVSYYNHLFDFDSRTWALENIC